MKIVKFKLKIELQRIKNECKSISVDLNFIIKGFFMAVPTYDKFIEPVLNILQHHPEGVAAKYVHDGAADLLALSDEQRHEMLASGQLVYKNRSGWAHDRLKRAGLSQSSSRGKWCLTNAGLSWIKHNPFPLSKEKLITLLLIL